MKVALEGGINAGEVAVQALAPEAGLRGSAAGVLTPRPSTPSSAWPRTRRSCTDPGACASTLRPRTHHHQHRATWGSQLAAQRLGPLMQATVPTPATASQLAASITFLLSDDGTNVNGAFLASEARMACCLLPAGRMRRCTRRSSRLRWRRY